MLRPPDNMVPSPRLREQKARETKVTASKPQSQDANPAHGLAHCWPPTP